MTDSKQNPESMWFGFTPVTPEEKTERVRKVFDSVATRYDLMNDLMSGGLHRLWKDRLVGMMQPQPSQTILDIAGGTGDIALRCAAKTNSEAKIIVCDINPAMLRVGQDKALDKGFLRNIEWLIGNAEALPLKDKSVDTVCIAFGLRNVTYIDAALKEFARVLKPHGRFFCLEFTSGVAPQIKKLYETYCSTVLPLLGKFVAEDETSYRYLAESIRQFPDQPELAERMKKAGFKNAGWIDLTGGIAVIHSGRV